MADTTTTTNLSLVLPTPSVRLGPVWAQDIVDAFNVIDNHDHTSGKGVKIPSAGLNINADLDFQDNRAVAIQAVQFEAVGSALSGASNALSLSVFSGDLYYTNSSGTSVQLTSGGSISASPGAAQTFETTDISGNVTISPSDTFVYLNVDTSVARTITLPLSNSVTAGRIYIIKDVIGSANTNNITIDLQGSDTIDGGTTHVIQSNYGSVTVVGDGSSAWYLS